MKNRIISAILIPMVVLIWGVIIFKIIKHLNNKGPLELSNYSYFNNTETVTTKDTISLILNYRDPFLNSGSQFRFESKKGNNPLSNKSTLIKASLASVNFPDIKYSGIVINSKNKQKVGLIKIAGKDFLAKEGELASDVKISKLYTDSVIVIFSNIKRAFYKK